MVPLWVSTVIKITNTKITKIISYKITVLSVQGTQASLKRKTTLHRLSDKRDLNTDVSVTLK